MFRNLRSTVIAAAGDLRRWHRTPGRRAGPGQRPPPPSQGGRLRPRRRDLHQPGRRRDQAHAAAGNSRPRWATDGRTLAYLHGGELWQMNADGTGQHRVTAGRAAGPAYSPDGQWLAYSAPACLGGPGVYRVRAAAPHGVPEVLFPAACREQARAGADRAGRTDPGPLVERLRYDDAIAWSPDGTNIAFRGGDCESVYDNCLSVGTSPRAWSAPLPASAAAAPATATRSSRHTARTGRSSPGPRTPAPPCTSRRPRRRQRASADRHRPRPGTRLRRPGRALVTAQYQGRSRITLVDLATGNRARSGRLAAGSQP